MPDGRTIDRENPGPRRWIRWWRGTSRPIRAGVVAAATIGLVGAAGVAVATRHDPPPTPRPHGCQGGDPLVEAVDTGQVDEVEAQLDAGARADAPVREYRDTPLICAVRRQHTDIVALLLDAGADPDPDAGPTSPLIEAVERRDADVVSLLLDAGADPDRVVDEFGSPLLTAAHDGSVEMAELLVDAGADLGRPVEVDMSPDFVTNETPLVAAAAGGHPEMVDWLLDAGAAPSDEALRQAPWSFCPTSQADTARGDRVRAAVEITRRLLEVGVDANAGPDGPSPLLCAAGSGDRSYVDLLLRHGADPDHGGRIPRGRSWDGPENDYLLGALDDRVVRALPDPGSNDVENIPPLVVAAGLGDTETAERLLAAGADPDLACDGTYTPIMLAAATGERAMVERLLRHGADPTPQVDPAVPAPADVARAAGHGDVADLLAAPGTSMPS